MNGKSYPDETKAAVMAALLTGQSVSSVAKEYNIPKRTVSGWKRVAHGVVSEATQKRELFANLLFDYVETNLKTLKTQSAKVFTNETWLKNQSASELAVLHGVVADKTIRILEAWVTEEELQEDLGT